jgi:hypothetical protein
MILWADTRGAMAQAKAAAGDRNVLVHRAYTARSGRGVPWCR